MIKNAIITKSASAILMLTLLSACGGTKSVPMTIQSEPLGAHVTYQVHSALEGTTQDWSYLGTTPLDIKRKISTKQLRRAQAFRVRVLKDGFSDQVRDWNGKEINEEIDEKGHVYWNPKLVPSS